MTAATTVVVTARLATGAAMTPPYDLDLAGLLAAQVHRRDHARAVEQGTHLSAPLPDTTGEDCEDLTLPLARCTRDPALWHWAASCANPTDPLPLPEPRINFKMVDTDWARVAAARPLPYAHPRSGPYRDVLIPRTVVVTPALTWRAVGDIDAIAALLHPITAIGKGRGSGEGRVRGWSIEPGPDMTETQAMDWVHHDGQRLLRPVPPSCADTTGLPYDIISFASRPPSWHPDRLADLAATTSEGTGWATW